MSITKLDTTVAGYVGTVSFLDGSTQLYPQASGTTKQIKGNIARTGGKWYLEYIRRSANSPNCGIINGNASIGDSLYINSYNGNIFSTGSNIGDIATPTQDSTVIGLGIDTSANRFTIWYNGVQQFTTTSYSWIGTYGARPYWRCGSSSTVAGEFNFGTKSWGSYKPSDYRWWNDGANPNCSISSNYSQVGYETSTITISHGDSEGDQTRIQGYINGVAQGWTGYYNNPNTYYWNIGYGSFNVGSNSIYVAVQDPSGNLVNSNTVYVTRIGEYLSQYISDTIPTTMTAGNTYSVNVTMKNNGADTWTAGNSYSLGSPGDSDPFAAARQGMGGSSISYGQQKTFTFNMVAPSTPGNYSTDWKMVRDGVTWFGDTLTKSITVNAPPIGTNINGVWKNGLLYINVGGVWKLATKIYSNVNGVWK